MLASDGKSEASQYDDSQIVENSGTGQSLPVSSSKDSSSRISSSVGTPEVSSSPASADSSYSHEPSSLSTLPSSMDAALVQAAHTPWWIDALTAVGASGVIVFNAAGFPVIGRILALIVLLVGLYFETKYSANAHIRSDRFLMVTLAGVVLGFIIIIIGVVVLLSFLASTALPWLLFVLVFIVIFALMRIFRHFTAAYVAKENTDKKQAS